MIINIIIQDMINALHQYGLYTILASFILLIVFIIIKSSWSRQSLTVLIRKDWLQLLSLLLIFTYLASVISITILSREAGSREGINLRLFATVTKDVYGKVFPLENILLFIPLGILLPLTWRGFKDGWKVVGVGLVISVLIEVIQFLTRRGYLQTDDVITNLLGTLCGYLIYLLMRAIRALVYKVEH